MNVYVFNKVAYLPTTINASTTFTEHFKKLGWQHTQLDLLDNTYEIFGHYRDPIVRHFKGTVEFLRKENVAHLVDDPTWQRVWKTAVFDLHGYPITWALNNRKVHWIPIGNNIDTTELTRKWLHARNITLGLVSWKNKSNSEELLLFNKLKEIHDNHTEHTLCYFYDSDILLWNSLFPYIDEDNIWHTIY